MMMYIVMMMLCCDYYMIMILHENLNVYIMIIVRGLVMVLC